MASKSKKPAAGVARKRGRPAHKPTDRDRQLAEVLSGYAIPQDRIASVLKITVPTLLRHYRDELDRGTAVVEAKLVGNLLRLASGTDGTALKAIMFSLQTRFGWTQYAPDRPARARETPLGKKEIAKRDSLDAHEGTEWSDLVH